ncbi:MAG: type II toxin-antitoxin system VapC family toxin [Treponema sp.]|nr:type II toxin-antitoxin system VapC family toxin [Treponema sp.]
MNASKIFIDTAPFIYLLEDNNRYSDKIRAMVSEYYMTGALFSTSMLTFTEYCVVPYRQNNIEKIKSFEMFLTDADIFIVPLTKEIANFAAQLRAKYFGLKSMDALQLASAIQNKCDIFLTNDKQLKQVTEIECMLVGEL